MIAFCRENRKYIKSEILDGINGVRHAFTTSGGGVRYGKFDGFNLGFNCGDNREAVLDNYRLAAADLDMPFDKITASKQTHSANIRRIDAENAGVGVSRPADMTDVDGLMTDCRGVPLVIFYADCVPVILADTEGRTIAAVHSGWRGTAARIAEKAVKMLGNTYGVKAENIRAAIGPAIGKCCFKVGEEVLEMFDEKYRFENENGGFTIDLKSAIHDMLTECGVASENIDVSDLCTVCGKEEMFSYRRQREKAGRMGAFVMLENDKTIS